MGRNYSNNAVTTTLSGAINAVTTSITVASTTGFPAVDFILALEPGTANQELVLVTGVAGSTLTVTRGYDNTTAVSHSVGATVQHSHAAKDFADSRTHEAATVAHGATGAVVGTTNTQTLTNKTLTLASNTLSGTKAQFNTALSDADFATLAGAETLTNKTLTSPVVTGLTLDTFDVSGAWTAYTPSLTNWTLGNGTITGKYVKIGKTIHYHILLVLGGTTGTSGNFVVDLPSNSAETQSRGPRGIAHLFDTSASSSRYGFVGQGTTAGQVNVLLESGTVVNGTAPWTWASGDYIEISGTYEAA